VIVRGITESGVAVTINDVPAILEQNGEQGAAFRGSATLVPGDNEITVVASDNLGNQSTRILTVRSIDRFHGHHSAFRAHRAGSGG